MKLAPARRGSCVPSGLTSCVEGELRGREPESRIWIRGLVRHGLVEITHIVQVGDQFQHLRTQLTELDLVLGLVGLLAEET